MNETPDDQETPPPAIWTDEVTAPPMIDIAEAAPPTDLPPIQIHAAEMIDEDVTVVDERSLPVKCWSWFCNVLDWLFGMACVIAGLALVATIPIAQFLSLGYLLEVSGRISRTGRISEGFIGIRQASRVGSIVLGTWLMFLPIRFASTVWSASQLIDPDSRATAGWRIGLLTVTVLMIGHIVVSWSCGGKLRHFFWPFLAPMFFAMWGLRRIVSSQRLAPIVRPVVGTISKRLLRDLTRVPPLSEWFPPAILLARVRQGGMYVSARDTVWEFAVNMRLHYYFWLGLRGFAGAIVWLFVPVMLIIATTQLSLDNQQAAQGLGGLAGFIGSMLLMVVVLYLPFMQTHFAAQNRFVAMFELGTVRKLFRQAPLAFWFALLITVAFAIPLYLLKIEYPPREILWLPSLLFVIFILPARIITGWALGRAMKRKEPRYFLTRWIARLGTLPVVVIYVFFAYFSQYTSWYGPFSLFEQHAFLPPVSFLGL
ncbi:MAG: hypothetical protein CMJ64_05065 [Planctomycetaceae bacterium]|nr:hypothetical protein [Planctomycetaceae bacterium]